MAEYDDIKARKLNIISLTERLLSAIACNDYDVYSKMVDSHVTCFEPESCGMLVQGIAFHKFYFDNRIHLPCEGSSPAVTICHPNVHLLGDDAACIAYTRLIQVMTKSDVARTLQYEETRIWQRRDGRWLNVHFHRSEPSPSAK